MKKNLLHISLMLFIVAAGFFCFRNIAVNGNSAKGSHIWLSSSTIKFVNNWLQEGATNLNFVMYEDPKSIEFNSLKERQLYISYPPMCVIMPYICARISGADSIDMQFIKRFSLIMYLIDTLLIALIFCAVFWFLLKVEQRFLYSIISAILSLCWMCLPINLYFLRNIYFSDMAVIPLVLTFILLEIIGTKLENKSKTIKSIYLVIKCLIATAGVLTDYYFLFVLFTSWLVKVIPLLKNKKQLFIQSLIYVLPVIVGFTLFFIQLKNIPNFEEILRDRFAFRTGYTGENSVSHQISSVINHFKTGLSNLGFVLFIASFIIALIVLLKNFSKNKTLFGIFIIISLSPILQIFVFLGHSNVHSFSIIKLTFPLIFLLAISFFYAVKIFFNDKAMPVLIALLMILCVESINLYAAKKNYFSVVKSQGIFNEEMPYFIKNNTRFEDVCFSFTENIPVYPPMMLTISNKRVYNIDNIDGIPAKFPHLNKDAKVCLLVNKNKITAAQDSIIKSSYMRAESDNFILYEVRNF